MSRLALIAALVIATLAFGPAVRDAGAVGCDTPGTPTTTVYLPNITKTLGGPSGWVTPFIVQNVGATATTLEVSFFRFSDGLLVTCRKVTGLAPDTSFADVPNNDADLPDDSQFAVVVRSFGSQVVSVVNEHQGSGSRAESLSYVGLNAGSTTVALPYVAKAVNGWLTTFVIQNLGSASATVTASFTSHDGTRPATLVRTIGPGRSAVVDPTVEAGLAAGIEYAATLSSTQPIAVVVNAHNDAPSAPFPMGYSYNGIAPSAGEVYLPWAGRNVDGGRYSRILVQNMGTGDATPAITFRQIGGSGQAVVTAAAPVRPGRVYSFTVPSASDLTCPGAGSPTCPALGEHSVVVSGGLFAVLSSASNQASAIGLIGGSPAAARAYLPNITRTLGGASGWTTPVILQSAGATTATLRWYRFADGALVATQFVPSLTAGASVRIDPRTVAGLADDTQYAVVVDAAAPMRAIVLELNSLGGDGAMAYEGFAATGTLSPAPVLTSLTLAPTIASVALGKTQQFSATVKDQFGNALTGVPITWSATPATIGTINASGLFTAGGAAGSGTLTAAFGSLSATSSLTTFSPTVTIGGFTFNVWASGTSEVYAESTITTADAQTIVAVVDPSVAYIEAEFGRKFAQRPAIYAFRDTASMAAGSSSVLGWMTPSTVNGVFVSATKKIGLNWGSIKEQLPHNTARHELVHMMESQVTQGHPSRPVWFIEGLAQLHELSEPRGQHRVMETRYQVASMAATGTLFATRLSREEFRALGLVEANAAYHEGAETVRLMRSDLTPAGFVRFLERIGQGTAFNDAYLAVAGRSLDTFLAGRDQRLRALAPAYPGIASANDTFQGAGLSYMLYGFAPGSSVTETVIVAGYPPSVRTVQADPYGTYGSYLGSGWPAGSYTLTAVGGGQTATTTVAKLASVDELVSGLASEVSELPQLRPAVPARLPQ